MLRGRGSKAYKRKESGVSVSSSKKMLAKPTFAPVAGWTEREGQGFNGVWHKRRRWKVPAHTRGVPAISESYPDDVSLIRHRRPQREMYSKTPTHHTDTIAPCP